MSPLWEGLAVLGGAVLALARARSAVRSPEGEPVKPNYADRPVPAVLGRALVVAANTALAGSLLLAVLAGPVPLWTVAAVVLVGSGALLLAGARDDRSVDGTRGLGSHLGALFRGSLTTGILKIVVGGTAAVGVALVAGGRGVRVAAAVLLVALSVNVTNALDVRPGRALKWGLLILLPVWLVLPDRAEGFALVLAAYVGASAGVLGFDLAERGMLGDAGSNPLGLVVGSALAVALPLPLLLVALAVLVALQVAAETVTISRLIDATPPARWLDELGRRN